MSDLKLKLQTLPMEPGCYLMKDASNTIIYVGKAKKLKSRVNSYFNGAHDYKTTKLVSHIVDFDYFVTKTEKEALILEINLIKQHRPRFNIMFMDDKSYPYLKLTHELYPRLKVARDRTKDKKATYFGPYPDASAAHTMRKLMNHLYPVRKCEVLPKKVCLYYHLGQCLGPCEFKIDPQVYTDMALEMGRVLKGDDKALRDRLTRSMHEATEVLNYEKAKEFRDDLRALDYVLDRQYVAKESNLDRDAFAYVEVNGVISIQGLLMRRGKLLDRSLAIHILVDDAQETFLDFIVQYYQTQVLPDELLLPYGLDVSLIQEVLDVKIHQPQRGELKQLMELVTQNAAQQIQQKSEMLKLKDSATEEALNVLKDKLQLNSVETIELIDNSHIQGAFASSAVVVFRHGQASKKDYRLYNNHNGADDAANMEEVIYRRYLRLIKEKQTQADLLLVDGGLIQIRAALKSVRALNLDIPVFGLVKDEKHSTSGLMDESGERIETQDHQALFFMLTRMQDEVHRFVLAHHQKRRSKGQVKSILDEIEGLGPQRKQALLKRFKNLKGIQAATTEELLEVLPKSMVERFKHSLDARMGVV